MKCHPPIAHDDHHDDDDDYLVANMNKFNNMKNSTATNCNNTMMMVFTTTTTIHCCQHKGTLQNQSLSLITTTRSHNNNTNVNNRPYHHYHHHHQQQHTKTMIMTSILLILLLFIFNVHSCSTTIKSSSLDSTIKSSSSLDSSSFISVLSNQEQVESSRILHNGDGDINRFDTINGNEFIKIENSKTISDSVNSGIKYYKTNFEIGSTDSIYITLSPCIKYSDKSMYLYVGINTPNIVSELNGIKMIKTESYPIEYSPNLNNHKNIVIYIAIKTEQYQTFELTVTKSLQLFKINNKKISINLFKQSTENNKYRYGLHLIWYPPNMEISSYKYKAYFTTQNSVCNLDTICGMLSDTNCKELSGNEFYPYSLFVGHDYFNQTFYLPSNFDDKEIEHLAINILTFDSTKPSIYGIYNSFQYNTDGVTNLLIFIIFIVTIPFSILLIFVIILSIYICKRRWMSKYGSEGGARLVHGDHGSGGDFHTQSTNQYQYDVVY